MGLGRSLTIGKSALKSNQVKFDVISNNIANTSTIGFKNTKTNFSEQFSQIYNYGKSSDNEAGIGVGGMNPYQLGTGIKVSSITTDLSQGVIETTNRPLDLALQGSGYFIYNMNGKEVYSRAGALNQDTEGNLVDSGTGAFLRGYNVETDANGKTVKDNSGNNVLSRSVDNVQISPNTVSSPKQTETVKVGGNLNANSPDGTTRQTSINIYDDLGGSRTLNFTFTKTDTANEYTIDISIDGNALTLANNTLTFNTDGTLQQPANIALTAVELNAALGGAIVFDETTPKNLNIVLADPNNLISDSLTQFAGPNTATAKQQDGYKTGDLLGMNVDAEGKIWGSFTNGQSEILGQVLIAKFANPEGLIRDGNNFLIQSANSGSPNIGTAGESFIGTSVVGMALEQSNVELTDEFTEMITTQRAFEAASRTILVTDQMLALITMLKR
jgi:flagellar hook protein FlgE